MKKVYEAPEFLSEDVLDVNITSDGEHGDNVTDDPFEASTDDQESGEFSLLS